MKKAILILFSLPIITIAQSSHNLSLIGTYEWPTTKGSDIWGWVNQINGDEYALVCLNDGFSCVNISNPSNPVEQFHIADLNSEWRDVKTWGNYAYITTEANAGLLIVDLNDMTGNTFWHVSQFTNTTTGNSVNFTAAHNLYIDENGICYIFGASSNNGGNPADGAIFLDVASNPINPIYLGEWDDEYIHDGMVRGDTMYAGCTNTGYLNIVNVSNKNNTINLGSHQTPNTFTHNAWISDNGNYVFTTDEKPDAYIAAYDITDISNIQEVDRIQSNPESNSIPHNTHVDGNFLVTSWYRDGTTVHDISNPNNLVQVAYYDSYAGIGDGFDGCWGTYPFLPSGNIISSDINSSSNGNGRLLIYERGFIQACYLSGNVTDANTGQNISGATAVIINTTIPNLSTTSIAGTYNTGNADAGTFDVVFSMQGYISDTLQVTLINGQIAILNASLYAPILGCMNPFANNYNPNANASIFNGGEINNTFSSGGYSNGNQHLIFNASAELLITSAVFYSEDQNTITFELRDSTGIVIDDTIHSLVQGQQQLSLNLEVPIGNGMELGISSGNTGLYRNNSGANYPYFIGSIMNITGASNQSTQDNWYYFYNIEVEATCQEISNLSWDCDEEGNCINPLSGNGQYISLDQCQSTCISTEFKSHNVIPNNSLIIITDLLGRKAVPKTNQPLFYHFNDGSVVKKIITE